MKPADSEHDPTLLLASAACDVRGGVHRPGAVAVERGVAVAWADPRELRGRFHGAREIDLGVRFGPVLALPGMVNAHAHLDLAGVGPRPYRGDFAAWVREEVLPVRRRGSAADGIRSAAADSLAAGVEAVGDVAGSPGARAALAGTGLRGVSFEELFGLGEQAVEALSRRAAEVAAEVATRRPAGGIRPGLQPHAPYSVSPAGYAACVQTGLPLSTHLAELAEEAEFVGSGTGPLRAMLGSMDLWRPGLGDAYRGEPSPVAWLRPHLQAAAGRFVVAHANHVRDEDIATLAATGTSVAYCPVASAYFGHTGHRYREMLDAGVNVALGTDSALCQPPDEPQPHGILPQARFLFRRDGTDPGTLVRMATAHGFGALGLETRPRRLTLVPIDPAGADPLVEVFAGRAAARGLGLAEASAAG